MSGPSSRLVLIGFVGMALAAGWAVSQAPQSSIGTHYALLVGVRQCAENLAPELIYADQDVTVLADVFKEQGYQQVMLLTQVQGERLPRRLPVRANIRKALKEIAARATEADSIVVALAGPGVHFRGGLERYFCALDSELTNKETLLSLSEIRGELDRSPAGFKLVMLDADRNDRRFDGMPVETAPRQTTQPRPRRGTGGVATFSSCSAGGTSFESSQLQAGLFFHYLTDGLRGGADFDGDGKVDLNELVLFTKNRVAEQVNKEYGNGARQVPELAGKTRAVPLATHFHARARDMPTTILSARQIGAARPAVATNSIGMKLVLIPAGSFLMGSVDDDPDAFDNEKPRHLVEITGDFYLGQHEVTRGQFRQFAAATGYRTDGERDGWGAFGLSGEAEEFEHRPDYSWKNTGFPQSEDHPVVNVSWKDAKAFCDWLSHRESQAYRLPTEAEWEYACRAGSALRRVCGNDPESLAKVANTADASAKRRFPRWTPTIAKDDGHVFTAPVGSYLPNPFGLHDMHGNVWEWCEDWYEYHYYANSPVANPPGPSAGLHHVIRGGAFDNTSRDVRSASRYGYGHRDHHLGFRLVRVPSDLQTP